jgi:uncharacterized protein (TIGR02996 family)
MSDEAAFLAAIRAAPADDLSRLVYADWLAERGRAEGGFLRAECELAALAPADPRRDGLRARLREAGAGLDPGWLAAISRAPVEGCGVEFRFRCPKRWEQLRSTAEDGVRFCGPCRRKVFFCPSVEIAPTHAALGECVAVDPRLARTPGDLESSVWELDAFVTGMPLADEEPDPKSEEPPRPSGRRRG